MEATYPVWRICFVILVTEFAFCTSLHSQTNIPATANTAEQRKAQCTCNPVIYITPQRSGRTEAQVSMSQRLTRLSNQVHNLGVQMQEKLKKIEATLTGCVQRKTTDIDECASKPCQNGGTCVDGINKYTCTCPSGYSGTNCQTAAPCTSKPCQNGGTCIESGNTYSCTCAAGFRGTNCQTGKLCAKCSTAAQGASVCGKGKVKGSPPTAVCMYGCYITLVSAGNVVRGCISDIPSVIKPRAFYGTGSVCSPSPSGQETCMCLQTACNRESFTTLGGGINKANSQTTCKCPTCPTGKTNPYKCFSDAGIYPGCRCSDCTCDYGFRPH